MKKLFFDKYGDVHEAWKVTGAIFGAFVIVVVITLAIAGIFSVVDYGACSRIEAYESQHDYRWGLFTGCLVQTEQGYWVDSSNPVFLEIEGE